MANRDNHYEAAFEAYLRITASPTLPSTRPSEAFWPTAFHQEFGLHRLVARPRHMVGRREGPPISKRRRAENSIGKTGPTRDDLRSLAQMGTALWARFLRCSFLLLRRFGRSRSAAGRRNVEFRNSLYGFVTVPLDAYAQFSLARSRRVGTRSPWPAADFRRLARPLAELLGLG